GDGAPQRGEEQDGDLAGEPDHPEQERRAGEAVDEPRLGDRLHPGTGQGDDLAAEEELVVPVAERAEDGGNSGAWLLLGLAGAAWRGLGGALHSGEDGAGSIRVNPGLHREGRYAFTVLMVEGIYPS